MRMHVYVAHEPGPPVKSYNQWINTDCRKPTTASMNNIDAWPRLTSGSDGGSRQGRERRLAVHLQSVQAPRAEASPVRKFLMSKTPMRMYAHLARKGRSPVKVASAGRSIL